MSIRRSNVTSKTLRHLTRCGIEQTHIRRILSQVHVWVKANGPEWTVNRLKTMKNYILQKSTENPDPPHPWIKVRKGRISGVFRVLDDLASKDLVRALAAFNIYTAYCSPRVTDKQLEKSISAITAEISDDTSRYAKETASTLLELISLGGSELKARIRYEFRPVSLNTGKPASLNSKSWVNSFIDGLYVPRVGTMLSKMGFDDSVTFTLPVPYDDMRAASPGSISCIQERGYKLRVVAMPKASVQVALHPLHKSLSDLNRTIVTDCTFDQDKGAFGALEWIRQGRTVHSVDLSSATDYFPRAFQRVVLEHLGFKDESLFIERLCSLPWFLSEPLRKKSGLEYVSYVRGQPQGLYSSFPLFALSHNILLDGLCQILGITEKPFYVLGDDVVIGNDVLAKEYKSLLGRMGCPISHDKTLTSQHIAEFAGFIIMKDGISKPPKVPKVSTRNFVSYVKSFGYDSIKDLPAKLRKVATAVAELPEFFGGFGFNPYGKSLEQRCAVLRDDTLDVIPKYTSFIPDLLHARMEHSHEEGATEVIDWLSEQESQFSKKIENELFAKHPHLYNLPTELRGLSLQLNPSVDVLSLTNYFNKSSMHQHAFSDELSNWSNRLSL